MGKFKDLTGMKFGKLTVIERAENYVSPQGMSQTVWKCKCDCGNPEDLYEHIKDKGQIV